jgi:hypothetical protein
LRAAALLDKTLLVCDFETAGIPLDDVLEFLELVAKQSNQQPVLYGGNVLKDLGAAAKCPRLADYRLWLAQYGPKPVLPKGYKSLWLWQYSESGTVPGIDGNVDLNAFNGSEADLKANWVVPVSAAASMPEQNASEEQGGSAKAHISASDQASSLDSSTQPPSTSTIEETKAVTQQTGNTTQAVQTTVTTSAPKGDDPSVPPTQVSKRGPLAMWLFSGGGLASLGTVLWGFVQTNLNAIAVGMVCLTVLTLAIIFRHAITDAIRMQTAADPDKKNVS